MFAAATFFLASPPNASAEDEPLPGTIKIDKKHSVEELKAMARIPIDQADAIALEAVEGAAADKTVVEHELEVEGGVLVYSIEVKVKGKKGVDELLIDAGDGKILKTEHERH
jgi:uncharacterized membrane protein YkoI